LFFVERNSGAYFGIFKLDKLIVFISFAMPAGENGEGFFMAVFVA
jgi:hypothetical protein